jgi:LuxR family transcriptional regulator, quorum-sensing system regulator SolR
MSSKLPKVGNSCVTDGQIEAEILQRIIVELGLNFFVLGRDFGRSWRPHALSNCPADFFEMYFKSGVDNHDPVWELALKRRGLLNWRISLNSDCAAVEPAAFRRWAASKEIRAGYSASFIGTGYQCDVISVLAFSEVELDKPSSKTLLGAISQFWHSQIDDELAGQTTQVRLTARELNVLQWMKEGKSYGDIATITGLTPRSIEFHSRNVLHKLDAADKTTAVLKAVKLGLVPL